MEYGLITGLAQDFGANERINDLYRQEEALNRSKAMAEQKAKLYADSIKYQNAMNPRDHENIKKINQKLIMDLGVWAKENPNYKYDPTLMAEFNNRLDEIKSGAHVLKGMATDKNFAELDKDLQELAKNPEVYDTEAYDQILAQKKNYEQFGNQDGYEAAQKEGEKAFLYRKPKNFISNMAEDLTKTGANVNDFDVETINDYGGWYTKPKQSQIDALKAAKYQEHGRQLSVMARKNNWTAEQLDKYVEDNIRAGVKKDYNIGDVNAGFNRWIQGERLKLDKKEFDAKYGDNQDAVYTTWDYVNEPQNKMGRVPAKAVLDVYGDKPTINVSGKDGTKLDLTGRKWQPDGVYTTIGKDKFFGGYIDVPPEEAEQMGVYNPGSIWKAKTDKGINSQFSGIASLQTVSDEKGNVHEFVRIQAPIGINKDDRVARKKWEMATMPTKQVPATTRPSYGQKTKTFEVGGRMYEVGAKFEKDGKIGYLQPDGSIK